MTPNTDLIGTGSTIIILIKPTVSDITDTVTVVSSAKELKTVSWSVIQTGVIRDKFLRIVSLSIHLYIHK